MSVIINRSYDLLAYDITADSLINLVAPEITGDRDVGDTLTCSEGTWSPDSGVTFEFQWYRDGEEIEDETEDEYVLTGDDVGAAITCIVTATASVPVESSAVSDAAFIPPANTVAPAITGSASQGATLSCSEGTWTGSATITFTYQWNKDDVAIGGATNSTYVTQVADIGAEVGCVVTADNGAPGTVSVDATDEVIVEEADYATWDPAADGDAVLSNGDRTASYDPVAAGAVTPCLSTAGKTSGKYYVEFAIDTGTTQGGDIAVIRASNFPLSANPPTAFDASTGFDYLGVKWLNGNPTAAGQAGRVFVVTDVVGLVIDFTGELVTLFVNNVEVGSHTLSTAGSGAYYLACSGRNNGQSTIITLCTNPADMAYSGRLASESASTWQE